MIGTWDDAFILGYQMISNVIAMSSDSLYDWSKGGVAKFRSQREREVEVGGVQ
jgi:hypothetical protein